MNHLLGSTKGEALKSSIGKNGEQSKATQEENKNTKLGQLMSTKTDRRFEKLKEKGSRGNYGVKTQLSCMKRVLYDKELLHMTNKVWDALQMIREKEMNRLLKLTNTVNMISNGHCTDNFEISTEQSYLIHLLRIIGRKAEQRLLEDILVIITSRLEFIDESSSISGLSCSKNNSLISKENAGTHSLTRLLQNGLLFENLESTENKVQVLFSHPMKNSRSSTESRIQSSIEMNDNNFCRWPNGMNDQRLYFQNQGFSGKKIFEHSKLFDLQQKLRINLAKQIETIINCEANLFFTENYSLSRTLKYMRALDRYNQEVNLRIEANSHVNRFLSISEKLIRIMKYAKDNRLKLLAKRCRKIGCHLISIMSVSVLNPSSPKLLNSQFCSMVTGESTVADYKEFCKAVEFGSNRKIPPIGSKADIVEINGDMGLSSMISGFHDDNPIDSASNENNSVDKHSLKQTRWDSLDSEEKIKNLIENILNQLTNRNPSYTPSLPAIFFYDRLDISCSNFSPIYSNIYAFNEINRNNNLSSNSGSEAFASRRLIELQSLSTMSQLLAHELILLLTRNRGNLDRLNNSGINGLQQQFATPDQIRANMHEFISLLRQAVDDLMILNFPRIICYKTKKMIDNNKDSPIIINEFGFETLRIDKYNCMTALDELVEKKIATGRTNDRTNEELDNFEQSLAALIPSYVYNNLSNLRFTASTLSPRLMINNDNDINNINAERQIFSNDER
ncbi:MAG: hypothetical protein MHMPM18_003905 [Marteilia pararefringens]